MSTFGFTKQEALRHWNECLSEQTISKADLEYFKKRKSYEFDCFNACVMRKRGSINNGKIDVVKLLSTLRGMGLINNSRTQEQLQRCASVANKERNECFVAKNMLDCFFIK
ncbi:uncharacterized protein LOC131674070 [Phymastichus coffea]|uniref:uncharacterized protein LOC131674070 n=1 Tax=Phymastichus coffea TaxID=108790 RepID=UPI00273B3115|nr:uncharacterized protein LOC131674070 [Phymastichus coffea]